MPRHARQRREAAAASLLRRGETTRAAAMTWTPAVAHREVLKASRRVVRLQLQRRRLRRNLAVLNEEITAARRDLKAVMGAALRDDEGI
jgi:hypothetical protein